jgi:bud site selection protein 31
MYYNQKKITREVYEFALEEKYADANLIAKWKKVST